MRVTREFLESAVSGDFTTSRELAPVLKKCAVVGSQKARGTDHAEDIEQELWIFLMQHVERIDTNYNIEPYLIETARKMTLARKRKYAGFGTDGEDHRVDGIADLAGGESSTFAEVDDALVSANDRRLAMNYLLSHSPALAAAEAQGNNTMNPRYKAENKNTAKRLNEDQQELRKMRVSAGLSQPEMAARLGLKLSTLQSYEYGRTKKVKKEIMDAARRLSVDAEFVSADAQYSEQSIKTIAKKWMQRLGIRKGAYSALADILLVDRATVSRWFSDKPSQRQEPTIAQLAKYERSVATAEVMQQKRNSKKDKDFR